MKNNKVARLLGLLFFVAINFFLIFKFHYSFVEGLLLIAESFLLYLLLTVNKKRLIAILAILIFSILSLVLVRTGFDKYLFSISGFEKNQILTREEFYKAAIPRIYFERIGNFYLNIGRFDIGKISVKTGYVLDLDKYFVSSQNSIYPLILFPFFLIGFIYFLSFGFWISLSYLILALLVSIVLNSDSAFLLFIPLINVQIFQGFKSTYLFIKSKIHK